MRDVARAKSTGKRWLRLYTEIIEDPKVQRLSPELFKAWINLLALAGQSDGVLPSIDDIAFKLRMSVHDAQSHIDGLILAGLLDVDQGQNITPHNWDSRQYISDSSTDRVRKFRSKKEPKKPAKTKAKRPCNVSCNGIESDSALLSVSASVAIPTNVSGVETVEPSRRGESPTVEVSDYGGGGFDRPARKKTEAKNHGCELRVVA
jgi:hypothetical protein